MAEIRNGAHSGTFWGLRTNFLFPWFFVVHRPREPVDADHVSHSRFHHRFVTSLTKVVSFKQRHSFEFTLLEMSILSYIWYWIYFIHWWNVIEYIYIHILLLLIIILLFSYIPEAHFVLFTTVVLSKSFSYLSDYSLSSPSCPVETTYLQMCWCLWQTGGRSVSSCVEKIFLLLKLNKLFKNPLVFSGSWNFHL